MRKQIPRVLGLFAIMSLYRQSLWAWSQRSRRQRTMQVGFLPYQKTCVQFLVLLLVLSGPILFLQCCISGVCCAIIKKVFPSVGQTARTASFVCDANDYIYFFKYTRPSNLGKSDLLSYPILSYCAASDSISLSCRAFLLATSSEVTIPLVLSQALQLPSHSPPA